MSERTTDIVAEDLAARGPTKAIEHWQQQHKVPAWKHAGAARLHGWGVGRELDEGTYLTGVEAFASRPMGA